MASLIYMDEVIGPAKAKDAKKRGMEILSGAVGDKRTVSAVADNHES